MRLWVHVIWLKKNPGTTLMTCGPKEDKRFEALVTKWGEEISAWAWWLYVNSDPPAYHLAPVQHVHKYSYNGQPRVREMEDQGAITRFPLSAFLAVEQGFSVQAAMLHEEYDKQVALATANGEVKGCLNNRKYFRENNVGDTDRFIEMWRTVLEARKKTSQEVSLKWGYADRDTSSADQQREEDEF